ncbi:pantetheine-phosphate adenylyltransferase [Candidatus Photodesmus blepharus]|nr:pantetheine-phosphate adenylyltransferase [Candidatus Photodesmus blepharus]
MDRKRFSRVIYPGTFDPITNGHLDLIYSALNMFDEVVVAVAESANKQTLFTLKERLYLAKESTRNLDNLILKGFSGLIVDFARCEEVNILIRGLRTAVDFEYEFGLMSTYRHLMPGLEGVFLTASAKHSSISSSIVREVAIHGGNVDGFVPEVVAAALQHKIQSTESSG